MTSNDYADIDIEQGEGKYLKIDSGQYADINILSPKPVKQTIHWVNKEKKDCAGAACVLCEEGSPKKQRWVVNVWDRKKKKVRIFEFGPSVAKQIKGIAEMQLEDGKTIHDTDLRIKVEGSGLETEYTVMPRPISEAVPDGITLFEI